MSEALFYDPAALKVVRAILVSSGIRGTQDLEDAIHAVVLKSIEHVRRTGRPPETVDEAIAIARPIAKTRGLDEARKRVRRGKANAGLTGEADEHAREPQPSLDPVDKERMLGAIGQVLKDDQIELLADVSVGVSQAELAAESGTAPTATRKQAQRSRAKAMGALGARGYWVAGGFAALIAGASALYVGVWRGEPPVAHGRPDDDWRQEQAGEQRREAIERCEQRNWDACEGALDRAARLDAEGDRAPEVAALRAAIAAGRRGTGARDGGGE